MVNDSLDDSVDSDRFTGSAVAHLGQELAEDIINMSDEEKREIENTINRF